MKNAHTHVIPRRRHLARAVAVGVALSVSPMVALGAVGQVSAASPSSYTGLSVGASGDAVRTLQNALIAAGIPLRGGADGVFGQATKNAVTAFQQARGLAATGAVDEATAIALGLVAAPSPLVGLKIGSSGTTVKQLQQALIAAGISVRGGADGQFGPVTQAAVSSFQQSKGLSVTGVVDEATGAALGPVSATPAQAPLSTASSLLGLRIGARGESVKVLQRTLMGAGITVVGGADGVFGPATANALSQFQGVKGLAVNASVDDATAAALAVVAPAAAPSQAPSAPAATAGLVGLAHGALGNNVKTLQRALMNAGVHVPGGADGIFGPATANALKTFQSSQGLGATGTVDAATAAALGAPAAAPAPGASPNTSAGYAVFGERGDRVKAVQQALVNSGLALRGGVDGVFGAATSGAIMNFQKAKGLTVTGKIDDATAAALALVAAAPPAPAPVTNVTLQAFPMQGKCYYGDTFSYPRSGGRTHEGVDLLGAKGLNIYAVADGRITKTYSSETGSLTGNGLRLTTADGTYFFYAHLDGFAPGIGVGTPVKAGQIIGYNGATGNAGTPHLHFEVHPRGGAAVNPYSMVKALDGCSVTAVPAQP
jgi:peptidoglycan hydrolase-like protein with peptidoglycan-binding domain